MSSPRNIDLFLSDDVISWSGETDSFKEKVFPRKSDLFPHFSKKSSLLEKGNRYFGEMGSLAASEKLSCASRLSRNDFQNWSVEF